MFTRNWYAAMGAHMYSITPGDAQNVQKSFTGNPPSSFSSQTAVTVNNSGFPYIGKVCTASTPGYSNTGVVIGSGTTPPSIEDYKLENRIITPTASSGTVTSTFDDSGVVHTSILTITNNHTEAITIAEIGLYAVGSNKNGESYSVLYDRTLLENPITIEPGGVGQITYTIRMDFPAA